MTQAEVARIAKVSKAYVGHLENSRVYHDSGRSINPRREVIIRLAQAVRGDINEALLLAGYASPDRHYDSRDVIDGVKIQFDESVELTDEEKEIIMSTVRLFVAGVKAKQK